MNKKEVLSKLHHLNLTEYEAKVYYALCTMNLPSATEIATASTVPRSKVYTVLRTLAERGMIKEIAGNVKRFSVIDPAQSFQFIEHSIEDEYKKKQETFHEMAAFFSDFVQNNNKSNTQNDHLKIIRKKEAIINNIQALTDNAHEEILFFVKGPYFIPMTDKQMAIRPLKRGVLVRSLYEEDDLQNPAFRRLLIKFHNRGEKIRIAKSLPVKLAIMDRQNVVYALVNKLSDQINFTGVVVNHADLAMVFRIVFEQYWNLSESLDDFFKRNNYLLK